MSNDCKSELGFLARDPIYNTIKPYSLRFDTPDSSPRHNLAAEKMEVTIHDARTIDPTIEENGFTLTSIPTEMSRKDFYQHAMIENVYANELETHLKGLFGARHVRVIDYVVRRRHPDFPVSTGENYENQQPAAMVHLDFSHQQAIAFLKTLYGKRADEILQSRWQIINVWRPLKGPLFDWPLAICDARTFNQAPDAQVSDAVYPEWAYENVLVHFNPDQKWYYFSALQESETMLFKCTDSDKMASGGCPHGSFPILNTGGAENLRESIESRAFILWAPIDDFPKEVGIPYGKRD